MKDQIIEILSDLNPDVDYATCTTLIDDRHISSLNMLSLIVDLEEAFDVDIPAVHIVPENFNSVDAIAGLIGRLQEEDLD
ncbi:MAG TPA: acyl carrier protein [Eggerthellaceae bacterium]|nr:acyl carrier protein [Eggerthellaceae bacterium]